MASDAILQILFGGQQLGGYLPFVQDEVKKFQLNCREWEQIFQSITAILNETFYEKR